MELSLIIVESPVIAQQIRSFQVPGLVVESTSGMLWEPEWDAKTSKLKAKARKKSVDIKRTMLSVSNWAVNTYILADTDLTGLFNAIQLQSLFKKASVNICPLPSIRASSFTTLRNLPTLELNVIEIERAFQRKHQLHQAFMSLFGKEGLTKACVLAWAIAPPSTENNFLSKVHAEIQKRLCSTLDLYAVGISQGLKPTKIKNELQQLHLLGLISYPRTYEKAFSDFDWTLLYSKNPLAPLASIHPSWLPKTKAAHASLFPMDELTELELNALPLSLMAKKLYFYLLKRKLQLLQFGLKELEELSTSNPYAPFLESYLMHNIGLGTLDQKLNLLLSEQWISVKEGCFRPGDFLSQFIPEDETLRNELHITLNALLLERTPSNIDLQSHFESLKQCLNQNKR